MRRIKKAKIQFISLVPRGMNQLPVLYKSEDSQAEFKTLIKDSFLEERGELLTVIYSPETPDGEGDVASAAVIKEMAYDAMRDGVSIDIKHDGKVLTKEQIYVAENFIIAKGDERFQDMTDYYGTPVDVTGGWGVVFKIDDPDLRKLYREGGWNGVSMLGPALMETETVSKADEVLSELLRRIKLTDNEDIDMDKKEVQELIKEAVESSMKELTASLKKTETKPKEPDAPKAPVFEGDPTSAEELKKHLEALQLSKIDFSDTKQVAAYLKTLEKSDDDEADDKEDTNEDSEELKKEMALLTKRLEKAEKKSAQKTSDDEKKSKDVFDESLSKEQIDLVKAGQEMAAAINASRGYKV